MKNKILDFLNSAAVLVLFMSLGMYDSENIIVPIIMSAISGGWILLVAWMPLPEPYKAEMESEE